MTANPKKAAVLGLLGVAALYFWAPLMAGWFKDDKTEKPEPRFPLQSHRFPPSRQHRIACAERSPIVPAQVQAKPKEPQPTWQQLVEWIEADPQTKPATDLPADCDPFRAPLSGRAKDCGVARDRSRGYTATRILLLTSTIVGSGLDVARINGKSYRPGSKLIIKLKNGQKLEYTIVEIDARSVVLERLGEAIRVEDPNGGRLARLSS